MVLLSIIPEKKSRYLVPILFPLAINTGLYVYFLIQNFKHLRLKKDIVPAYFNFGLFGLLGFAIPIVSIYLLKNKLDEYWIPIGLLSISLIAIGIYLIKSLKEKNIKKAFYGQVVFMLAILLFGMPLQSSFYDNSYFHNISHLKNTVESQQGIFSYTIGSLTPELLWYYEGNITDLYAHEILKLPKEEKFGLLIEKQNKHLLELLPSSYSKELIGNFDLNYFKKKRDRLERDYYLITKNTTFE